MLNLNVPRMAGRNTGKIKLLIAILLISLMITSTLVTASAARTNYHSSPTPRPTATPTPTPLPAKTFGNNIIGATIDGLRTPTVRYTNYVLSDNANITSLTAYVIRYQTSDVPCQLGIYSDNSGNPGKLLVTANIYAGSNWAFKTGLVNSVCYLTAGVYWFALTPTGEIQARFTLGNSNQDGTGSQSGSSLPLTGNVVAYDNVKMTIYANYQVINSQPSPSPTVVPTPTKTPTPTPSPTAVPTPTRTPTPTPTITPSSSPTVVPTPTKTPTPTPSPTAVPTPTRTPTPTPTITPSSSPTVVPTPTKTPTPTPSPTAVPTPTRTPTPTPTITPSPSPLPSPTSSPQTPIKVYSDAACTVEVSSISWGALSPGATTNLVLYVRNIGAAPVSLSVGIGGFSPSSLSSFLTLGWDYSGQVLNSGGSLKVTLALTVLPVAPAVANFGFSTTITATG